MLFFLPLYSLQKEWAKREKRRCMFQRFEILKPMSHQLAWLVGKLAHCLDHRQS